MIALLLATLVCACQAVPGEPASSEARNDNFQPIPAPKVVTVDQDGKTVDLGKLYENGTVLVYFYPKADTPGCTAQACSLRDAYQALTERGIIVLGVSLDSAQDQKAFKEKHNLPFTLIPDVDKKMVEAFGVSHGAGFASREAFLIKDSQIVWHDDSASTSSQAEDVLKTVEGWQ